MVKLIVVVQEVSESEQLKEWKVLIKISKKESNYRNLKHWFLDSISSRKDYYYFSLYSFCLEMSQNLG